MSLRLLVSAHTLLMFLLFYMKGKYSSEWEHLWFHLGEEKQH